MPLVVKRKLGETWREAVGRRGGEFGLEQECLEAFEAHLAEGRLEAEAAFLTLRHFNCLFLVPDGPAPERREEL